MPARGQIYGAVPTRGARNVRLHSALLLSARFERTIMVARLATGRAAGKGSKRVPRALESPQAGTGRMW